MNRIVGGPRQSFPPQNGRFLLFFEPVLHQNGKYGLKHNAKRCYMRNKPPSISVRSILGAAFGGSSCPQVSNNQLTGYSPSVNNILIYANTNNLLHFGIVIPVRDHSLLMVVSSLALFPHGFTKKVCVQSMLKMHPPPGRCHRYVFHMF